MISPNLGSKADWDTDFNPLENKPVKDSPDQNGLKLSFQGVYFKLFWLSSEPF